MARPIEGAARSAPTDILLRCCASHTSPTCTSSRRLAWSGERYSSTSASPVLQISSCAAAACTAASTCSRSWRPPRQARITSSSPATSRTSRSRASTRRREGCSTASRARSEVTVVPGNHDIYLPPVQRERRFPHHFGAFLRSDLPEFALDLPAGPYPVVKLRGPAAIIALSSAVPRPPFIAAGFVGAAQLAALGRLLGHPEVARRTPVILIHHPPVDSRIRLAQLRDGLVDAASFRKTLAPLARGLVLFGHLHVRVRCVLQTAAGALDVIGASGAALDHPDSSVRAGFNLYEIDDDGGSRRSRHESSTPRRSSASERRSPNGRAAHEVSPRPPRHGARSDARAASRDDPAGGARGRPAGRHRSSSRAQVRLVFRRGPRRSERGGDRVARRRCATRRPARRKRWR